MSRNRNKPSAPEGKKIRRGKEKESKIKKERQRRRKKEKQKREREREKREREQKKEITQGPTCRCELWERVAD